MKDDFQVLRKMYGSAYAAAFVATLSTFLGNTVGMALIGNSLGAKSLAAAGLVAPLATLFVALGNLMGNGGVLTVSQLIGKGKHQEAKKAFTVTCCAILLFAALIAGVGIPSLPIMMKLMTIPPDLQIEGYRYAVITLGAGVCMSGMITVAGFLKIEGLNKHIAIFAALTPVISISISAFCLLRLGMGIESVAIGNLSACFMATLGMISVLYRRGKSLKLSIFNIHEFLSLTKSVCLNGIATASDEIAVLLRTPIVNAVVAGVYGTLAVAAFSAYTPMIGLFMCIIVSSSASAVPMLGVFSTEHDSSSIRQLIGFSLRRGFSITILAGIFVAIFAEQLCRLFGLNTPEALAYAVPLMRVLAVQLPLAMFSNSLINFHNALGNTVISNVANLGRVTVFLLVPLYIMSDIFGINGVWCSFLVAEVTTITVCLTYSLIHSVRKKYLTRIFLINQKLEQEGKYISFSSTGEATSIVRCATDIDTFCKNNCLTPGRYILISLSIEEMLTSISAHSLLKKSDNINVRVLIFGDTIIIRIRNTGCEFSPLDYYYLDDTGNKAETMEEMLALEDKLGIKMVISTAKDIDYRRTFGINNLTITL